MRQETLEIRTVLEKLTLQVQDIVTAITTALPSSGKESGRTTADWEATKSVCICLAELLNADDYAAIALLRQNKDLLCAAMSAQYSEMERQIEDFDFACALQTLQAFCINHGIELSMKS